MANRLTIASLAQEQVRLDGEISGHQKECVQFRIRVENAMSQLQTDVDHISQRVDKWNGAAWTVAGSAAIMALSLIGWMAVQIWPPPAHPQPQAPVVAEQVQVTTRH